MHGRCTEKMIDVLYETFDGSPLVEKYHTEHGTESQLILTNYDDERCGLIADFLQPRTEGKTVVEIGAGIGLLACHVALNAKRIYAIEVDPSWASTFVACLYKHKPPNLTFIFGKAEECPPIVADVAFFCTHSGRDSMRRAAERFAPVVIDVYAEILVDNEDFKRLEGLTR